MGTPTAGTLHPRRTDRQNGRAEPVDVPTPITRRLLNVDLTAAALQDPVAEQTAYYGRDLSVVIGDLAPGEIAAADLRDLPDGSGGWAHTAAHGKELLLDPVLGRIAFADAQTAPPVVTYHRGSVADTGGGEYDRVETFAGIDGPVVSVAQGGGADHPTIVEALAALPAAVTAAKKKGGTVEIRDNATYAEDVAIAANAIQVELRAADGQRPVVKGGLTVSPAGEKASVAVNGVVVTGPSRGPDAALPRRATFSDSTAESITIKEFAMLTSLLPGLRELRTPLVVGWTWLVATWVLLGKFTPSLASIPLAQDVLHVSSFLGQAAMLATLVFIADLLGSLITKEYNWNVDHISYIMLGSWRPLERWLLARQALKFKFNPKDAAIGRQVCDFITSKRSRQLL